MIAIHYIDDKVVGQYPLRNLGGANNDSEVRQAVANRAEAVRAQHKLASTWRALSELAEQTFDGAVFKETSNQVAHRFYQTDVLRIGLALLVRGDFAQADSIRGRSSFLEIVGPYNLRQVAALSLIAPFAVGRANINELFQVVGDQYGMAWDLDSFQTTMLRPDMSMVGRTVFDWIGDLLLPWV